MDKFYEKDEILIKKFSLNQKGIKLTLAINFVVKIK